jgi:hypothetical protein
VLTVELARGERAVRSPRVLELWSVAPGWEFRSENTAGLHRRRAQQGCRPPPAGCSEPKRRREDCCWRTCGLRGYLLYKRLPPVA